MKLEAVEGRNGGLGGEVEVVKVEGGGEEGRREGRIRISQFGRTGLQPGGQVRKVLENLRT